MKCKLNGLACANCANKIETELNKMEVVKKAIVDFNRQSLTLELNDESSFDDVVKKIKSIESDVKVTSFEEDDEDEDNDLFKIIISSILWGLGLFLSKNVYISYILFMISYIVIGYEIIFKAIKNIFKGSVFDENFLMTIATIGAFLIGELEEAVAVMLFYSIGEFLQDKAVDKSRKSISALVDLKSDYANLKVDKEVLKVDPNDVKTGNIIVVKPGERVPLDGKVIKGSSALDVSALTGESLPIDIEKGNEILSGSIVLNGLLEIEVTSSYKDSTVARILDLIENSTSNKAKTEKFITKFAKIYTPIVVAIALMIAILLPLLTNIGIYDAIYKALICLVISCPCALVLSVPLSYFASIGAASKNGVLIKGANYLDILSNIDTIAFDKTGTLTKGKFEVEKIVSVSNYKEKELLEYAACAEIFSNHPIAKSIVEKYNKKIDQTRISNFKEISGKGIAVKVDDKKVTVGNSKIVKKSTNVLDEGTIVYVCIDDECCGYIVIADAIREESKDLIHYLKDNNIKTLMLTGDNANTAKQISSKIGNDEYYAGLLPEDKINRVKEYHSLTNKYVAFVGDGINDAPILSTVDLGIAMGGIGSDSAIEAAGVILMNDDISKIKKAIEIARKTKRIVIENITFSLVVKVLAIIFGLFGYVAIWQAVIADVGVTIIAVINSLRSIRKN